MSVRCPSFPIALRHIGFREAGAGYDIAVHSHNVWQWYCLLGGDVTMHLGGVDLAMEAGDHVLIPPGLPRGPRCTGRPPRYILAMFLCPRLNLEPVARRVAPASEAMMGSVRALLEELRQPGPYGEMTRHALMAHLLLSLLREATKNTEKSYSEAERRSLNHENQRHVVERAEAYMRAHLQRSLLREEIARAVHLSPTHLARLMRRQRRVSVGRRLTDLRLEQARAFLLESDLSVTQIAGEVGFASFSHFTQTFRRWVGVSPSEYRRTRGLWDVAAKPGPWGDP